MFKKRIIAIVALPFATALLLGSALTISNNPTCVSATNETHNHNGWTGVSTLPTDEGSYYLTDDITLSSTWNVPSGETNLCLNGHVINANGGAFSVIKIDTGATLNLYDCGTAPHYFTVGDNGLWTLTDTTTDHYVIGGVITGKNNSNNGAIHIDKGTLNMFGGNIAGNCANTGAGVYVGGGSGINGTFQLSGGKIIYNTANQTGGGVGVSNTGLFTMTGGEISNNNVTGQSFGGGVFTQSAITLGGTAKISGNTAKGAINNVYLYSSAKITLGTSENAPTTGMNVGVTLASKVGQFTTAGTANYSANFFSDNGNYLVKYNNETESSEFLELKEITIADILPEYLLASSDNKAENVNGYSVAYIYNNKLYFQEKTSPTSLFSDSITTPITLSGTNYTYSNGARDIIFNMNSNYLESITVSSSYHDYLDGEYIIPHTHGNWEISCNDNVLTAACGNSGCSETPYSVTLTLNANDEVFSEDTNHKYSSANAIWSDTTLGFPLATLKYYLVTDDGLVLTTNKNSGATKDDAGSAPRWAGNYIVKAIVEINETSYTIEKAFSITKAEITLVGFADKIEQPVATKTAKSSAFIFPTQTMYNGEISWSPSLLTGNKFDYNTVYTATVTLTANNNHTFKDGASDTTYLVEGWIKSESSTDTSLIYTKTYEKTGKIPQTVSITNDISKTYDGLPVSAPTYTKLGEGVVTIEYKLASEDDSKYTTTAPTNVGSYVVKVSVAESDTHLSNFDTAEFSISLATISTVDFTDISTPVANQIAPTSVEGISSEEKYTGTLSWSPDLDNGKFNFDTVYTATITLTIKDYYKGNYAFANNVVGPDGWTRFTSSTADTVIFTKSFTKTGHDLTKVDGQSPTCTEAGFKDAYYCNECEMYFENADGTKLIGGETVYNAWILDEGKISATGHNMTHHDAIAPTCTEDGTVEYWTCSHEDGVYYANEEGTEVITSIVDPALGHNMTHHDAVPPTCTEDGNIEYWTCSHEDGVYYANEEGTEILTSIVDPAFAHDLTKVDGESATRTEDGYKDAWVCSDCGEYFEDAEGTKLIGDEAAYNAWKLNEGRLPQLPYEGLSSGAIAGICIGSLFLLLVIIYLIGYFFLYRKGKLDDKKIKVIYKILPRGEQKLEKND